MCVLLNCFGFFKPAIITTERELFSECQIALFVADIRHHNYQVENKKRPDSRYNLLLILFIFEPSYYYQIFSNKKQSEIINTVSDCFYSSFCYSNFYC